MKPADPIEDSVRIEDRWAQRIRSRSNMVGVVGLGYVGLPLSVAIFDAGFRVLGIDSDPRRLDLIRRGETDVRRPDAAALRAMFVSDRFAVTDDVSQLRLCDIILICVPTPLDDDRNPDLSHITAAADAIAAPLCPGQLIVLESTIYPGTTVDVLRPILERVGLKSGNDFFLAFSPEREDPGNAQFTTATTPKVLGPDGPAAGKVAMDFYRTVVREVVVVGSPDVAEAVKLIENVFRSVNIALANELKSIFAALDIDILDVLDAAATKPFGFMPFYPGPDSGGHCIPIDPIYLTWNAHAIAAKPGLIEQAVEINADMPNRILAALKRAFSERRHTGISDGRFLIAGIAYKKNVADIRETPALAIAEKLAASGAHDPLVPKLSPAGMPGLSGRQSVDLVAESIASYDAALICPDHDAIDVATIVRNAQLVIDTRNATRAFSFRSNVVQA